MPTLLIDKELIELVNGEFVESDIELPDNLLFMTVSLDNIIIAICEVGDFILIYELEGRRFELKHNINRHKLDMPSSIIILRKCSYIQNLLIVKQNTSTPGTNVFTIIDLKTSTILHMCYGCRPQYCDGILTFRLMYNSDHDIIHDNINLVDKTVTRSSSAPYFMEKINQIIIESYNANKNIPLLSDNVTCIGNEHYFTTTATLLGTGLIDKSRDRFYGNYFIKINKLEIAPGAPIVEYEYKGRYLYIFTNAAGKLTKAAAQQSDD